MTAHYLAGKAEIIIKHINNEYLSGDTLKAHFLQSRFETVMLGMDILLRRHPLLNLDKWLEYASKSAVNEKQRKQYETNARRIVTIWGPPVDDYSARLWGGLIGQYYLERWRKYFESRTTGTDFHISEWESQWVENNSCPEYENTSVDVVKFARLMIDMSRDISITDVNTSKEGFIGHWKLTSREKKKFVFNIMPQDLKNRDKICLEIGEGDKNIVVLDCVIEADGKFIIPDKEFEMVDGVLKSYWEFSNLLQTNNSCLLYITLGSSEGESSGVLYVE